MEDELWKTLRTMVLRLAEGRQRRGQQFSDARIVLTLLWSALHERPICWACRPRSWPRGHRPTRLPSPATMSRRWRTENVQTLMHRVHERIRQRMPRSCCKWIDALPLPVGGSTHDRQARYGRAAGVMAKGYKLHAICDSQAGIEAWAVRPMNVNEKKVAMDLVVGLRPGGYLVGDGAYHSAPLFDAAAQAGYQLVSPKPRGAALGHRRQSPHRLRGLALLTTPLGDELLRSRLGIDRFFGHWGNAGVGLKPLPHWVRTLHRVRLWLHAKLLINAVRLLKKQEIAT